MGQSARVTSIETVERFRNALCEFGKDVQDSLGAAEMQIHRTFDWLAERLKYWQHQIRVREEELVRAKIELTSRKFANRDGKGAGITDQEKAFRKRSASEGGGGQGRLLPPLASPVGARGQGISGPRAPALQRHGYRSRTQSRSPRPETGRVGRLSSLGPALHVRRGKCRQLVRQCRCGRSPSFCFHACPRRALGSQA